VTCGWTHLPHNATGKVTKHLRRDPADNVSGIQEE
jgi:hypothetical protein